MVNEESILGLLIRAYGQICAQELNEQYHCHNGSAASAYKNASEFTYNAIMGVVYAEICVRREDSYKRAKEDARKELAKEMQANVPTNQKATS
jgi:hypothetical protein